MKYIGEQAANSRDTLTVDSVSADMAGLQKLIVSIFKLLFRLISIVNGILKQWQSILIIINSDVLMITYLLYGMEIYLDFNKIF